MHPSFIMSVHTVCLSMFLMADEKLFYWCIDLVTAIIIYSLKIVNDQNACGHCTNFI